MLILKDFGVLLKTYDEIEAETTLYRCTLEEIIHEDLKMKKLAFR